MKEGAFSRPVLVVAALVGGLSLAAGFAGAIFAPQIDEVRSAGADGFSRSAIGHHAFVELLRRSGRTVVVTRRRGAAALEAEAPPPEAVEGDGVEAEAPEPASLGAHVLLLCLEPNEPGFEPEQTRERLRRALAAAPRALIALPKREGVEDPEQRGWLESADLVASETSLAVLEAAGVSGELVRDEETDAPWISDAFEVVPDIEDAQLVRSADLDPLVSRGDGVLAGLVRSESGAEHLVLSDPDLLSNRGLGRGENAALALALVDRVAGPIATILIDETLHGHVLEPNVWSELGRFPLLLTVLQVALALGFLLWSGIRRFGAPAHERAGLAAGKRLLIENTAELLLGGGHSASMLRRYVEYNLRRVSEAYHLPPSLSAAERRARLEEIHARTRGATPLAHVDLALQAVSEHGARAPEVLRAALAVRRFREEMLDGAR